jgi:hypothetical protein
MAQNIGTLVTAAIRPNDSLDLIASAFANEVKGGHHGYATLAERDALITARREWGMFVSVYNDGGNNGVYKLEYNYVDTDITNNANWIAFSGGVASGTTWVNSVISRGSTPPTLPNNGDRYLVGTTASGDWFSNEKKIAQYNSLLTTWNFTTPDDGYCVVVNNEPNTFYRYQGTYSSGNWVKQIFGGLDNKYLIENETIEVPYGYQYFIYGDLTIGTAGSLINYGQVVTLNGDIIIQSTGTFSNYGLYYSPSSNIAKYSQAIFLLPGIAQPIIHNLATQDISVSVYEELTPFNFTQINVDVRSVDPNTVIISSIVPVQGKIVIIG